MFDVIWTDHNRELVGERRARKDLEKTPKKKEDVRSARSSISTASSSSARNDKPLGFLGSISRMKTGYSSKGRSLSTAHSNEGPNGNGLTGDSYFTNPPPVSTYPDEKLSMQDMAERRSHTEYERDSYENTPDRSSRGGKLTPMIPPCLLYSQFLLRIHLLQMDRPNIGDAQLSFWWLVF